jgi:hypothetical protein
MIKQREIKLGNQLFINFHSYRSSISMGEIDECGRSQIGCFKNDKQIPVGFFNPLGH